MIDNRPKLLPRCHRTLAHVRGPKVGVNGHLDEGSFLSFSRTIGSCQWAARECGRSGRPSCQMQRRIYTGKSLAISAYPYKANVTFYVIRYCSFFRHKRPDAITQSKYHSSVAPSSIRNRPQNQTRSRSEIRLSSQPPAISGKKLPPRACT